jgi:uncharacterized cupin superfamily protein
LTSDSTLAAGWMRISREMRSGQGLQAPAATEDVHSPGFLKLLTPDRPAEKRLEVLRGDIWVALFEQPEGAISRCDFFPGDEFVYVLSGSVTLTDARSGEAQTFGSGRHCLIPKGWQGTWDSGPSYREVAVCSRDWLSPYDTAMRRDAIDPGRRDTVVSSDVEDLRRARILGNDMVVQLHSAESELRQDAFVHVISGGVTITEDGGAGETFGPDDCFVLSRDFRGAWQPTAEYVGLVVTDGAAA